MWRWIAREFQTSPIATFGALATIAALIFSVTPSLTGQTGGEVPPSRAAVADALFEAGAWGYSVAFAAALFARIVSRGVRLLAPVAVMLFSLGAIALISLQFGRRLSKSWVFGPYGSNMGEYYTLAEKAAPLIAILAATLVTLVVLEMLAVRVLHDKSGWLRFRIRNGPLIDRGGKTGIVFRERQNTSWWLHASVALTVVAGAISCVAGMNLADEIISQFAR